MTRVEPGFWRGYWPLLMAFGAAQLSQQADIVMIGLRGGAAPAAYAMLMRLALLDVVLMSAMGVVASTAVAEALRNGDVRNVVGRILGLAALIGICAAAIGLLCYPRLTRLFTSDPHIWSLVDSSIYWYALSSPFRFLGNTAAFTLHACGQGVSVVKWRLIEFVMRGAANYLVMHVLGVGFEGCFIVGAISSVFSAIWFARVLSIHEALAMVVPRVSWALDFLRSAAWESQRIIALQLAVLACFALFAAPWLGNYDISRLDAYAAGQTLMLVVFAPFMAQVRFLAFRFATLDEERLAAILEFICGRGALVAIGAALLLFASEGPLGRLYGQDGPWWTIQVQMLAASLPIRYASNIARAVLLSRNAYAMVATIDTATVWVLGAPLVAAGLYLDSPAVAYLSLVLPELAGVGLLWSRLAVQKVAPQYPRRFAFREGDHR
jgi:Na+-driven multidrug efflux pump